MTTDEQSPSFRDIDWEARSANVGHTSHRTRLFLASVIGLGVVFAYDYLVVLPGYPLVFGSSPTRLNWLAALAVLVLLFYVVWPLAATPRLTREYWLGLRRRPAALLAVAYLCGFAFVALLGPELIGPRAEAVWTGEPSPRGNLLAQPPAFSSVTMDNDLTLRCAGEIRNDRCHGTLRHPLGTTRNGEDVLAALIDGSRTVFQISVITAVLFVPLAVVVGTTAAYFGGRVDEVLMRYLDLQQVVPGFLVYLLWEFLYGPGLFAIVLLFGVLDWGRVARQVRADAARKRDAGYFLAARDAGVTPAGAVRRHLVPNVADTLVAAVVRQVPFVLIAVVTLTFLGTTPSATPTWSGVMKIGLGPSFGRGGPLWWSILFPLLALVVTIAALGVLGTAFRDVLDPREP